MSYLKIGVSRIAKEFNGYLPKELIAIVVNYASCSKAYCIYYSSCASCAMPDCNKCANGEGSMCSYCTPCVDCGGIRLKGMQSGRRYCDNCDNLRTQKKAKEIYQRIQKGEKDVMFYCKIPNYEIEKSIFSYQQPTKCEYCRVHTTKYCSRCKTNYCSRECQVVDWHFGNHKKLCKK